MEGKSLKELEVKALSVQQEAKAYLVKDEETLKKAHAFLVVVRTMRKEINETFDPIITKAHIAHKEAIAQKKKHEEPLQMAEMTVKPQIAAYMGEQLRIQKEAEAKATQERMEIERKSKEEEEARLKAALNAENAGDLEKAEEIINEEPEPVSTYTPLVPQAPKIKGTSVRKIPKWRVINHSIIPREYLIPNDSYITRIVKVSKGEIRIPGIEVYSEDILSMSIK